MQHQPPVIPGASGQQQQPGQMLSLQQQPGMLIQEKPDMIIQEVTPAQDQAIEIEISRPQRRQEQRSDTFIVTSPREPLDIQCPCGYQGPANLRFVTGTGTYIWCVVIFIAYWPLFCLPFCLNTCKDTSYVCPRCKKENQRAKIC